EQKRYHKSERTYRQQQDYLSHGILCRRQAKDRAENGADAGCPPKGEGKSYDECAPGCAATFHVVQALVRIERLDGHDAGEMQSEQNYHHTGDARERGFVRQTKL